MFKTETESLFCGMWCNWKEETLKIKSETDRMIQEMNAELSLQQRPDTKTLLTVHWPAGRSSQELISIRMEMSSSLDNPAVGEPHTAGCTNLINFHQILFMCKASQ